MPGSGDESIMIEATPTHFSLKHEQRLVLAALKRIKDPYARYWFTMFADFVSIGLASMQHGGHRPPLSHWTGSPGRHGGRDSANKARAAL